jgi:hypothetical protein
MPYTRKQAVANALASFVYSPGMCLQWTRLQFGVGPSAPDATAGWAAATKRHPGDRNPPVGVPVWWTGGSSGHGHVAVSLGGGKIRGTDSPVRGQIGTVPLDYPSGVWGLKYAGWSEDINGVTIPLDAAEEPKPTPIKPTRIERSRALLEQALTRARAKKNRARVAAIRAALKALPTR